MIIHRAGARPSRQGPAEYFTGAVRIDPVHSAEEPARQRSLLVTFEPGARTFWHTHPLGQTIHVLSGAGYAQTLGAPPQPIRPGDTVWFEPGEKHWHGAGPTTGMVHLAIQEALDGSNVDWLEEVAAADYPAT